MSTETIEETAMSDWPIAEEALQACPGAREYYVKRDEVLARFDELARLPEFPAVQSLRREQETHLAWFMHPDDMPYWLSRPEGAELTDSQPEPPQVAEPLEALPEQHPWMAQMESELGADDEAADAAVERFEAVHDEQGGQDWDPFEEEDDGEPAEDDDPDDLDEDETGDDSELDDDPEPETALVEAVEAPPATRTLPKWFPFRRSDNGPDEVA